MRFFGQKRLRSLLKCVVCAQRPGTTLHHHIPLCKSCHATLQKHIKHDGGFIVEHLETLRQANSPSEIAALRDAIVSHASKLVHYEDLKLKTIEPEPTVIMHLVRMGQYNDLFPKFFSDERTE
ncbi:hypothetical protein [Alicyclobacillus mengziensis]|uniref:Uncharacterized protein n=1 Tax=Alicyclobacillus mengziensis TaxID=2931921 RepID=A0A9X7VUT0_9BACL|nr:hypothetical protein [Alicyclobacillus mengziensis]QSO45561.1 hypothetical protein JZ786_13365 [Alicyclobacillus mengziensis]